MSLKIYLLLGQCIILCSHFDTSNALVGANVRPAKPHEFPALVAFMHNYNREQRETDFICTGTLVSRQHVVTAAHCLEDITLNMTTIIVGSRNIRNGRKFAPLWAVTYFRWANRRYINLRYRVDDILIIKLADQVSQNIPIPTIYDEPKRELYGKEVQAAGWGDTLEGATPRFLQTVNLTVLSNADCSARVSRLLESELPIPERFMCSYAEPYALMHYGDSGCPIFCNGQIVAIHKSSIPFPDEPLNPQKLNVHSTMEYYGYFIKDVIESNIDWF